MEVEYSSDDESSASDQSADLFERPPKRQRNLDENYGNGKTRELFSVHPRLDRSGRYDSGRKQSRYKDKSPLDIKADKRRLSGKQAVEETAERNVVRQNRDYIKLEKFDGSTPLKAFFIHLETCAEYNGWEEMDKLAQLKAALRGPAAQVLLGDDGPLSYNEICAALRQNFGTEGFETQFESQLRTRRRRTGEDMRSLYQDINKLVLQAYPGSNCKLRDKLATEAFIESLNDNDLALKVRNLCPTDIHAAYSNALMLESNQLIVNRNEEMRDKKKEI